MPSGQLYAPTAEPTTGIVATLPESTGAPYGPHPVAGLVMPSGQLYAPTAGPEAGMVAALPEATGAPTASAAMTAAEAATRLLMNMMRLLPGAGRPGTPPVDR
jgi:hypothetical protein